MKYEYKKPACVSFNTLMDDFTSEYDDNSEEAKSRVLTVNVWAYGICSSNPNNPFSPGGPYNQPGCFPS